jgi:uncharacterized membrane protein YbhN (UPF0104 family)/tRNA A-37 threonylcarbamoyl transferase component Bud32
VSGGLKQGTDGIRRRAFGHADERPYRRLTGDWLRLVIASLLVTLSALHVGDESSTEQAVTKWFDSLPAGLHGFFEALSRLGSLWVVLLVTAAALVARRWRLAAVLAASGATAWFAGRLVGFLVDGQDVPDALAHVFDPSRHLSYPTVPLAVTTAVVLAAAPFLARPTRRVGELVVLLTTVGSLYRSAGDVNAVFAAVALGWGVSALMHLVFGSPAGRPTLPQVEAALEELGVAATNVRMAPVQTRGYTHVLADRADGSTLDVRVYGRDAADTQFVEKFGRFVAYKDSGATFTFTRLQQVEHEALCHLVAREAGAHVPAVVAVGVAGPSAALLVTERVAGGKLTAPHEAPEGVADDAANDLIATLRLVWQDLARLHERHLCHGALDLDHVVVDDDGTPTIVGYSSASLSAPGQRRSVDVANLLVSSALVVGAEAAVRAAVDGIGAQAVGDAQAVLEKPALTRSTRAALRHDKHLLADVKEQVTAATGVEVLAPVELRRVKPITIAMVIGLLFAVWVILGQIGSVSALLDTIADADFAWVVVCALLTQTTQLAYACTTIGSVEEKVPVGPAVLMQYAVAFTNLVLPTGAASTVMNIRFLQKQGCSIAVATASGLLCGLSGTVSQFVLFFATAWVVVGTGAVSDVAGSGNDDGKVLLVVVFVAAVVIGIVTAVPRFRRFTRTKVWPQIVHGSQDLWHVVTTPRQLVLVLGGSFGAPLLNALGLGAALLAYGTHLSFGQLVLTVTGAGFVSSLVPVPGGIGVAEASLIALLTAFGVSPEAASAAVVTYRLFTTYLPPIPGSYATKWLVARGDL